MRAGKKRSEEEAQGFKRGGRGCKSCSPEAQVDIRVVGSEGYLVVLSACL